MNLMSSCFKLMTIFSCHSSITKPLPWGAEMCYLTYSVTIFCMSNASTSFTPLAWWGDGYYNALKFVTTSISARLQVVFFDGEPRRLNKPVELLISQHGIRKYGRLVHGMNLEVKNKDIQRYDPIQCFSI